MKCKNGVKDCWYIHNPNGECDNCKMTPTTRDNIQKIIYALDGLQYETTQMKPNSELYWASHYIENATMELRKALSTLKRA